MKTLIILLALGMLTGCGMFTSKQDVVIKTDHINVCGTPPRADVIVMRSVVPMVVEDKKSGLIFIGILPKEYENLSLNIQEMLKHIKQQNAIVDYYRNCYADNKKKEVK